MGLLHVSGCPTQVETTPGRALCYPVGDRTASRELHVEAAVGVQVLL